MGESTSSLSAYEFSQSKVANSSMGSLSRLVYLDWLVVCMPPRCTAAPSATTQTMPARWSAVALLQSRVIFFLILSLLTPQSFQQRDTTRIGLYEKRDEFTAPSHVTVKVSMPFFAIPCLDKKRGGNFTADYEAVTLSQYVTVSKTLRRYLMGPSNVRLWHRK